ELSRRAAASRAHRAKTGHTTSPHQKPAYRCSQACSSDTPRSRGTQLIMVRPRFSCWRLLLGQQGGYIAQRFLRAVLVVAVFADQALLYDGDFLARVLIGSRSRGHQAQHIAPLFEQVLLDGLAHARMARELELLSGLEGHHGLAYNLLAERHLAGV